MSSSWDNQTALAIKRERSHFPSPPQKRLSETLVWFEFEFHLSSKHFGLGIQVPLSEDIFLFLQSSAIQLTEEWGLVWAHSMHGYTWVLDGFLQSILNPWSRTTWANYSKSSLYPLAANNYVKCREHQKQAAIKDGWSGLHFLPLDWRQAWGTVSPWSLHRARHQG